MFNYFQVCHHYLAPLLSQITLDANLLKQEESRSSGSRVGSMGPPDRPEADKMNDNDNGDGSKENVDPLMQELQVSDGQRSIVDS